MKKLFVVLLIIVPISLRAQDNDSVIYKTETIEVDALRGYEGITPITFENVDREQIEERYWLQDLPMFLKGSTSINTYSESGASVGYSYLTLRGFDQRRISILINGIPQNDPEDHQVYWVDISDLTSSVDNIQIQRGIGTSLYGSSSVGGVINIQTIDFFRRKFLNLNAGIGSFNSTRFSLEYSSGLIGDGYGFYGKFTKIKTEGYRKLSWSDHWQYFLSAGKMLDENNVLKLNFFGGPIKNHLAYLGVTRQYLDGEITGNERVDRRYNFLDFPNESDNYNQPHYELVLNSQISENITLSNTLSYIRGDGFFVTNYPVYYGLDWSYFRLQPFFTPDSTIYNPDYYRRNSDGSLYFDPVHGYQIVRSNLVTNLHVNNNTLGWFPRMKSDHENGTLIVGGEIRLHNSEHYGEVTFGDVLPPGTEENHLYYFYNGGKSTYSIFANEVYNFTPQITGMLGVQFVYHKYSIKNDRFKPYAFDVGYKFFTPRVGLNYKFDEKFRGFVNISMAKREPRLKDIYDAENPNSRPNFQTIDIEAGIYEDPLVKPEEMLNFELGFGFTNDLVKADLNFYRMNFRNEIVNNGQLDNVGQPISGNAGKSVHQGIELEFEYFPFNRSGKPLLKGFSLGGNLTLSQNYFTDYIEVIGADKNGNVIYGNDFSDNRILLTPDIIGNLFFNYHLEDNISAFVSIQHIGKQYLDNSENERKNPDRRNEAGYVDKIIDPCTVVNLGVNLNVSPLFNFNNLLPKAEIQFRAENLFDVLYETSGSVDWTGTPYWIPAADRNFYVNLSVGF
ncbi:MAG: TonB-dependent receptor [Ignavibacteriaceae bacterium]|jgi:Outer membrane receptor proteins, mostly Fe transport|nr:MAG: TonB-dependent receptor [Chlorobiota bacterium]KXK04936.1 MAG: TonB-dependent receptor plug [Chlorobi bacterium OLB4]MBV6397752.1 Vitamin B12 transporter BtuB [Ignavibacteria bacterium]MCC6885532.1 TonB-dependent receptor [Ignavibacteriales bacterium]MCE7952883.1 TonB-dependent receptor [Chlorobi bacterium CHB7]MDL1886950.1 TonB-dependent receptor [Ignavibacteria bacterium CHB1]MEB2328721.1 TonB-dependent receptor [Ignavibacteriaceae bacterium]OQY79117.1 MAG: hypothetical protein B6D